MKKITEELDKQLTADKFETINIMGYDVEIRKMNRSVNKIGFHFCSYVLLPNSKHLSDNFLGNPTYREGDTIGFDTAHAFCIDYSELDLFRSAIDQITHAIKKYRVAMEENYYGED